MDCLVCLLCRGLSSLILTWLISGWCCDPTCPPVWPNLSLFVGTVSLILILWLWFASVFWLCCLASGNSVLALTSALAFLTGFWIWKRTVPLSSLFSFVCKKIQYSIKQMLQYLCKVKIIHTNYVNCYIPKIFAITFQTIIHKFIEFYKPNIQRHQLYLFQCEWYPLPALL